MAELPPKTMSIPISSKTMINGASHHFFLSFRNAQMSFKKSIVLKLVKIIRLQYNDKSRYLPAFGLICFYHPVFISGRFRLLGLIEKEIIDNQPVHIRIHEAAIGFIRGIHHRLSPHIEACIDQYRVPGQLFKFL